MTETKKIFGLSRHKSLKNKKLIDQLFKQGNSLVAYPLRVVWMPADYKQDEPFLVAFSVPKKKFKRAVDRNRIKRLMRESFRLQQNDMKLPQKTVMMWLYLDKQLPDFQTVFEKTSELIKLINNKYQ